MASVADQLGDSGGVYTSPGDQYLNMRSPGGGPALTLLGTQSSEY